MSTATSAAGHRVRRAADRIEAAQEHGRFRRRRQAAYIPKAEQLTLDAVRQATQGDDDALRYLYLRYADNVYGYVCSIVRDEHEAEDVTQHVFAKLFTALPRYEPRTVPFSAWILRVAHNAAIDHVRSRRRQPASSDAECPEHGDERPHDAWQRRTDLREALETLPRDQRDVIVMRFIHGLSTGEIAERMGRTEHAIHALQHRGRRTLRAELTRLHAAPAARA
jgi:RNA polymerase sigma-70 factor, ECF subfamily